MLITTSCTARHRRRSWRGILGGTDIDALVGSVAPSHVPGWLTPDVAMLTLAVSALDLASVSGSAPPRYDGLRERFLHDVEFRGRVDRNSQYALYAAACMCGGLQPDLLNDESWWRTPLWIYAVYATAIHGRAAADRRSTSLAQIAGDLAAWHGLVEDIGSCVRSHDSFSR